MLAGVLLAACPLGFAPPLDRPLPVVTIDERELSGRRHVFTQRRELRFARDGDGYRATLTQRAVTADADPRVAAALTAGSGALTGISFAFAVAADGCSARILDLPSARAALADARARMVAAAPDPQAAALTGRLLAPLLALDDAALADFLVAMIRPLLPGGVEGRPGPATRQAASPLGGAVTLTGDRTVTAHGGATHVATRLAGGGIDAALAERTRGAGTAAPAGTGSLAMHVAIDQALDAASGLVTESRTVTELRAPGPATLEGVPAYRIVSTTRIGGMDGAIGR